MTDPVIQEQIRELARRQAIAQGGVFNPYNMFQIDSAGEYKKGRKRAKHNAWEKNKMHYEDLYAQLFALSGMRPTEESYMAYKGRAAPRAARSEGAGVAHALAALGIVPPGLSQAIVNRRAERRKKGVHHSMGFYDRHGESAEGMGIVSGGDAVSGGVSNPWTRFLHKKFHDIAMAHPGSHEEEILEAVRQYRGGAYSGGTKSAWTMFLHNNLSRLVRENPHLSHEQVMKMAGREYRASK
jgi:hypothetical protein